MLNTDKEVKRSFHINSLQGFAIFKVSLGGIVVMVLAIGLKLTGSNPAEGDGLLVAIKIHSTTSFGGEVKPSSPCH
jgi:hypothetical protein